MAYLQIVCFLLCLLSLHIQALPESSGFIRLGSSLSPKTNTSSWLSPSGLFALGFYPQGDGFAVGIWLAGKHNITVIWTAKRDDPPVSLNSSIIFTNKDGLLLRTGQGEEKHLVELFYFADVLADSASMLDSGNFVIYSNKSEVIWESFKEPTDTILSGQSVSDIQLTASISTSNHSSGRFYLEDSYGGDLVAYAQNDTVLPHESYVVVENLGNKTSVELNLSPKGVLSLRSGNETVQIIANISKSVRNETLIYRATFDHDGILRLYSHRFKISGDSSVNIEWSAPQNPCDVKDYCGFNSFCSSNRTRPDCYCFPGFVYIDPDMKYLGCYRSFKDEEGCKRKEPAMFYNITNMENTTLGGYPYAVLSLNQEDCSNSCLYDCYCGAAAFYLNGTCSKFKLPLMFGMKDQNEPATVFVKWSSGNVKKRIPGITPNRGVAIESKKKLVTILATSLGFITFLCFLIAISSFLVFKLRVKRYKKLPGNSNFDITQQFTLQSFSYNELDQATDGFKEELGRGWFGAVYKGFISDGNKIIAVKRFENPMEEGERKFREEMAVVRQTHHRNLVRLLGFCMEGSRKLLVYEYMGNGSLADLIFNVDRRPLWKERVRIALDVARGILYLHEECEVPIIHCNINPQNILMDDSWIAKISNFSLAKRLIPNQSAMVGGTRGTRGYMAPEWQKDGQITVKSDVYSFGVVLLEIICCRSNMEVNVSTADEVLLSSWVYNCFVARELNKLVAEEEVDIKTLERMVKVGLLCIQDDPSLRPPMKNAILMLERTMDIPDPPFPSP